MKKRPEKKSKILMKREEGFILVLGLVSLVTLSLLGIWVMNSSTVELLISGNHQRFEESFQVADGGTNIEGGELGFSRQPWHDVSDPNNKGFTLIPPSADYDPGGDIVASKLPDPNKSGRQNFQEATDTVKKTNHNIWPMQNIVRDPADNEYDYAYLLTYLYDTVPPKGTGEDFAAYRFRINGNRTVNIELGGTKLGPKVVSFED